MVFVRDLRTEKEQLEQQSYVHLKQVLSAEFVSLLKEYGAKIASRDLEEVEAWYIPGKKRQYLLDFPSMKFLDEFCVGVAAITGCNSDDITLSERHIKHYLDGAPDFPVPHMDRRAAAFTIGFPIHLPEASEVCFFPHMSRVENTAEKAIHADLPEGTDMKQFYEDPRIIKLKGSIGDMIIFHGSTIYHERIRGAGAAILYIKVNAEGHDPLGEHASLLEKLGTRSAELGLA
jgi:hypothetical protein